MRILVTGGCGFIGSNFIIKQIHETKNIIGNLDLLTYAGNLDNLVDIENDQRYTFYEGDITNNELVLKVIEDFEPDVLINFAAESHVDRSINNPLRFIKTNVLGTAVLLKNSNTYFVNKNSKNKFSFKFLHISTDEVFGSLGDSGFFDENSLYRPNSPYSASKAGSDHLVRSWYHTYKFPTIVTNCSNNFGPYQFPEKLIPLMITNCIEEKKLPIYGDGLNVRDWLFVNDHCNALNAILNNGNIGETYNIGGNNEIRNIDLALIICNMLDKALPRKNDRQYSELITHVQDRPGHDYRYAIDSTKINNELNWTPNETFESGIRKTIDWYLSNQKWWKNLK